MQNVLLTDFTAGEISPKLSGRVDLALYRKGCSHLENFQPMTQGGTRRRPGTQFVADITSRGDVRLISFVVDETNYFLIELSNLKMRIWQDDELVEVESGVTEIDTPYTTSQLPDIHHTQSYDRIIFTHQSHPIKQLVYTGGAFTWGSMSITGRSGQTLPFGSTGNYPKTCAIMLGRLWLASTTNQPATIWASRPYEEFGHGDFTDYKVVTTDTIEYTDPTEWSDPSVPEYEEVTLSEEVYSPTGRIEVTLGSDRNEEVMWLTGQQDIIVGTMTGEYIIPGNITALEGATHLQSRYGSTDIQGKVVDAAVIYVQSDKKHLREYYWQSEESAYQSPDLTWSADHMLQEKVVDFDFQRTPEPRIYCTLADGSLKVLSYSRLYGVIGWSPWTTEGNFKQICVLDTPLGEVVYVIVERGSALCLEKLYEPYTDTYHIDCAQSVTSSAAAEITYPFTSTKWVIFDADMEIVTAPEASTDYTIGMLYTSDLILNRLSEGTTKKKSITEIIARVVSSYSFKAGYASRLYDCYAPTSGYPYTGDIRIKVPGQYNSDAQIEIKIETQRPLMITALVPSVEVV